MFSKANKTTSGEAPRPGSMRPEGEAAPASAIPSIISTDLKITGNLESSGDIQVDGVVNGDISSRTLTIGEEAHVKGSVLSESVRVCGRVSGEIKSTSVVLAKTARVEGDIAHQSLAIEAGAFVEGNIRRLEPETAKNETNVAVINPGALAQQNAGQAAGQASGGASGGNGAAQATEQPTPATASSGTNPIPS